MAQILLRDYLQETEDAISQGQHDKALARCQSILASYPESLDAQRLLGEVYLAQGRLDEAQQAFDWVLTNDPESVVAYCDRALISEKLSDYDTALDCYQQAYELSRGNSQIRQAFNRLSTRAGQQGFMFSRAGLARLYMRGDLLTQAIQEWEAVLAVNTERLDARTGLLETYWREGLFYQVEQQAKQIIQDVPGCVKALLLLACVTSARDMLQARELLHKVEALDPDLTLAHDLLSDAMASQPNDPFLQLLRKPPVTVDAALEQNSVSGTLGQDARLQKAGVSSQPTLVQASVGMPNNASPVQGISEWTGIDPSWNAISGLNDLEGSATGQEVPTFPWSSNTFTGSEMWNNADNTIGTRSEQKMPDFMAQLGEMNPSTSAWGLPPLDASNQAAVPQDKAAQIEPWMALQETLGGPGSSASTNETAGSQQFDSAGDGMPDTLSWNQPSAFSASNFEGVWGSGQDSKDANMGGDFSSALKDDVPAPPAWLSMLTQNDRKQMSGDIPMVTPTPSEPIPFKAPQPVAHPQRPAEVETPPKNTRSVEPPMFAAPEDPEEQDEESLFGPAWLKSLGAASMEAALSAEMPAISLDPSTDKRKDPSQPLSRDDYAAWQAPEPIMPQSSQTSDRALPAEQVTMSPTPAQEPVPPTPRSLQEMFSSVAQELSAWPGEGDSQDVLTTLENLEQELRSHGFTHLEPNTLASIARNEQTIDAPEAGPAAPDPLEEPYQGPSLSSALAGFGDLRNQRQEQANEVYAYEVATQAEEVATPLPSPDVSWSSELASVPVPAANDPLPVADAHNASKQETPGAEKHAESTASPMPQPETVAPALPDIAEEKTVRVESVDRSKSNAARLNAFLDNELETTMRRPAVRLPQGPPRPGGQRNKPSSIARNLSTSREEPSRGNVAASSSNASPTERLLRGYQHQLVGDYDEAMQEYRIVIRNAPEVLGEVVSNVRALLKLAPKYAPGYRVLGDAYMRQGEYLQAMEAYNKALTMAKRAKA